MKLRIFSPVVLFLTTFFSFHILSQAEKEILDYEKCTDAYTCSSQALTISGFESPFIFEDADVFHEGLARVKHDNKWGYINKKGKVIVDFQFYSASSFKGGLAFVKKDYKSGGFINYKGEFVTPSHFSSGGSFHEGLASVAFNNKSGYINKKGQVVIEFKYLLASHFQEGLAKVSITGETSDYIDKKGRVVLSPSELDFKMTSLFHEGLALISRKNLYGFANYKGEIVITPQWKRATDFKNGLSIVLKDNLYGFIDKTGKFVIDTKFIYARPFQEGLARVILESRKYGFINKEGNPALQSEFVYAQDFSEGLASVKPSSFEEWFYINKKGVFILKDESFQGTKSFKEGLAPVKLHGKWGFIQIIKGEK